MLYKAITQVKITYNDVLSPNINLVNTYKFEDLYIQDHKDKSEQMIKHFCNCLFVFVVAMFHLLGKGRPFFSKESCMGQSWSQM